MIIENHYFSVFSDQLAASLTNYFNLFCFVKRVVVELHFEPEDLY